MSATPLVSVCVPSYNASQFITSTLESVLNSSFQDFEIILQDDASTDDTVEVSLKTDDSRIRRFRNQKNVGVPRNWNIALRRAQGRFIAFLNHDDLFEPFWLNFAVHVFGRHDRVGWIASAFREIDSKGATRRVFTAFSSTGECDQQELFEYLATFNGLGPGYVARREALEEMGGYDVSAGPSADNALYLRLAIRYPLYYSTHPHLAWRVHPGNLTNRWPPVEQTRDGLEILHKLFQSGDLPARLRDLRAVCMDRYYAKILRHGAQRIDSGDTESAHQMLHLLIEHRQSTTIPERS
jgi:glycosyltransferase involved in cell wall biosynthesis